MKCCNLSFNRSSGKMLPHALLSLLFFNHGSIQIHLAFLDFFFAFVLRVISIIYQEDIFLCTHNFCDWWKTKTYYKVFHKIVSCFMKCSLLVFHEGSGRKISQCILSLRNYKMILYLQIIVIRGNFNNYLSIMTNIPSWTLLKN